jgi:hypothetical protein
LCHREARILQNLQAVICAHVLVRRRTNTKGILPNPKTVGQRMEKKILIKKMMRPESLR